MVGAVETVFLCFLCFMKLAEAQLSASYLTCPRLQTHGQWILFFMLQSELQGEQQLEETERVPDNYPYRLPPLSGRKEHTQSIMRGSQTARKDTDITAHCSFNP